MKIVPKNKIGLADIEKVTGLAKRQLRFVLDNNLVSGLRVTSTGRRGSARQMSVVDATIVATAAALLTAGLSAASVKTIMTTSGGAHRTKNPKHLWRALTDDGVLSDGFLFHEGSDFVEIEVNTPALYAKIEAVALGK